MHTKQVSPRTSISDKSAWVGSHKEKPRSMRAFNFSDLKDLASDAQHKQHLLGLVLEFDRFCEEHGLT